MNRGFLRWFYVSVQFVMLAVSIPKVATLFHAYNAETLGPLLGGVDLRSWMVGIAIDLTATLTTWAALHKYEESRKRTALFAPALIIIFCTGISVIANYEDAATITPLQYAHVALFSASALLINPLLISAPPVLVFLLILLVPSVLAQPRIKSAVEIAAEADEQEALIVAEARVREAKARANAQVRSAQLTGLVETVSAVTKRPVMTEVAPGEAEEPRTLETEESAPPPVPTAQVTRAVWKSMPLRERVTKSGIISVQEVAEVLSVSAAHARKLIKDVRASDEEQRAILGRSGVPYTALIDALYVRRTKESFQQAQKLEAALGLRKRTRQLHVVPADEVTEEEDAE